MRTTMIILAGIGTLLAVCECDYPLFPWVQLAGVSLMGLSAMIANRMTWD